MAGGASAINQPNRVEAWIPDDEERPLKIEEDAKIPNAATFTLRKQDHTLGNLIRSQLLLDPSVLFAGYKVPHPLENDIVIKIQTDDRSNPADALKRACSALIAQTLSVKAQFAEQARNIEMGMGPEQATAATIGTGAGAGVGGFDPYGDGGRGAAAVGGGGATSGDVYDF